MSNETKKHPGTIRENMKRKAVRLFVESEEKRLELRSATRTLSDQEWREVKLRGIEELTRRLRLVDPHKPAHLACATARKARRFTKITQPKKEAK